MTKTKPKIEFTKKLLNYNDFRQYSPTFIETGSAAGDGIQRALNAGFEAVVSIEAAKLWFDKCGERFKNQSSNVFLILGKSTEWLAYALNQVVKQQGPYVIFLDAHPAGPLSAGHAEWLADPNGEANQHNIITKELSIILASSGEHVIIIDDVNGMKDGCAEQYMEQMLAVNPNYKFSFYDENLSGNPDFYYHDKILVAIP